MTRRPLALAVLTSALALDIGGLNVMNAALPAIGADFGLPEAVLQWTMTGYALAFAGLLLFGGRAADVLGRRLVFTAGVALFGAGAAAGALAPDAELLIAARAAQGVGAALCGPAALALLAEVFPAGPARARAFGVYAAVGAAAGSGGFVLGGLLTDWFGWRSVLVVLAVLAAAVLVAVPGTLPVGARRHQPLDLVGAALVTAGLALAVFGVATGAAAGWGDPVAAGSLVAAAVLLGAFVVQERRTADPLLPLQLFASPAVRAGTLAALLNHTAAVGLQFFAPLYVQDVLGYSPVQSGLAVLPLSLAVFLTATFLAGPVVVRFGYRPAIVGGLVLIGTGSALWLTTTDAGGYLATMLPGLLVMGVGVGFVFPAMTTAALTGVDEARHGVAGAVNVTAQQVGASVGVAGLVAVAAASAGGSVLAGYHAAYLTAALACLVGAVGIALGGRRRAAGARPVGEVTAPTA